MKWIKASERLPQMETPLVLKVDGVTMLGNFYVDDQSYMLFISRGGTYDEFEKSWNSTMNVEWLDESDETEFEREYNTQTV